MKLFLILVLYLAGSHALSCTVNQYEWLEGPNPRCIDCPQAVSPASCTLDDIYALLTFDDLGFDSENGWSGTEEWTSDSYTEASCDQRQFFGPWTQGQSITKTWTQVPFHHQIELSVRIYFFGSWSTESVTFTVASSGANHQETFTTPANADESGLCRETGESFTSYLITPVIESEGNSIQLTITSDLGSTDGSWAISDFEMGIRVCQTEFCEECSSAKECTACESGYTLLDSKDCFACLTGEEGCIDTSGGYTKIEYNYFFEPFDLSATNWNVVELHDIASTPKNCDQQIMGNFGEDESMNKQFAPLPPLYEYNIYVNAILFDTWDDEFFYLDKNGVTLFSQIRNINTAETDCPGEYAIICDSWLNNDAIVDYDNKIAVSLTGQTHSDRSNFYVQLYSTLDQDYEDESWGVNDFKIQFFPCDEPFCTTCPFGQGSCSACDSGLFLKNSATCVASCGTGLYGNTVSGQCEACAVSNCETCSSDGSECLLCEAAFHLYQGSCTGSCPINDFYDDGVSSNCQTCPPACQQCDTSGTCLSQGVSGDSSVQESLKLRQSEDFDAEDEFVTFISDESTFEMGQMVFSNPQGDVPRILAGVQYSKDSSNMASAQTPTFDVSSSQTLTLHTLKVQPAVAGEWSLTAISFLIHHDFLTTSPNSYFDEASIGTLRYSTGNTLRKTKDFYDTIYASRVYFHDITNSGSKCEVFAEIKGSLRNLYINGESVLYGANIDSDNGGFLKLSSMYLVDIKQNQPIYVNLIGYQLEINDFGFENCVDTNDDPITPTFEPYSIIQALASEDISYTATTSCPADCKTCESNTKCIECDSGKYLDQDGTCVDECTDSTYYYPQRDGYRCQNAPVNFGFQSTDPSFSSDQIIIDYNIDSVESINYLLKIYHPFQVVHGNQPRPIYSSLNNPSLAQSHSFVDSLSGQNIINLSVPDDVQVIASSAYDSVVLQVYSLNEDQIMQFTNYDDANYKIITTSTLYTANPGDTVDFTSGLSSSDTYKFMFWIECQSGPCQMTVEFNGQIQIVKNSRTIAVEALYSDLISYELTEGITGTELIEINLEDSTSLEWTFSGTHKYYFTKRLLLEDAITVPDDQECSIVGCINCFDTQCLSCEEDYVLSRVSSTCVANCDNDDLNAIFERRCIEEDDCNALDDSVHCRPDCGEGKYYTPQNGCDSQNTCHNSCLNCYDEDFDNCYECEAPSFMIGTGECGCPDPSTKDPQTHECISGSFINIEGPTTAPTCDDITINLDIFEDEQTEYGLPTFTWEITTDGSDLTKKGNLQTQASGTSGDSLTMASANLENGALHTISVEYTNYLSELIQASLEIQISDDLPTVSITDGLRKVIKVDEELIIEGSAVYSCGGAGAGKTLVPSWRQISGDDIDDFEDYVTGPYEVTIPECSLFPGESYDVEFRVDIDPTSDFVVVEVEIEVNYLDFEIEIQGGDTEYFANEDVIELEAELTYSHTCNDFGLETEYVWSCQILEEDQILYQDCNDPNNIFGQTYSTPTFNFINVYPYGSTILLTVSVTQGIYTREEDTTITLEAVPIDIEIVCTKPSACGKYSQNYDYFFDIEIDGDLQQTDPLLNYEWNIEPSSLKFSAFKNDLRINKNSVSEFDDLVITCNVNNRTHNGGEATLTLPFNDPPQSGNLQISPSTGESLSTLFTFSANNWDDSDTPLNYEFQYRIQGSGSNYKTLGKKSQKSSISYKLPGGNDPSTTMQINLIVTDSYLRSTSTTKTIEVTIPQPSIEDTSAKVVDFLKDVKSDPNATPVDKVSAATVAYSEVKSLGSKYAPKSSNVCESCSGNGFCNSQNDLMCLCQPEYKLPDCSLAKSEFQKIEKLELSTLLTMKYSLPDAIMSDQISQDTIVSTLADASDSMFRSEESMLVIDAMLDTLLNVDDDFVLTAEQSQMAAESIDNMIEFVKEQGCSNDPVTQALKEKISNYIEKLNQASLNGLVAGDDAAEISTENFDIVSKKVTECTIGDEEISAGEGTPKVTLSSKNEEDCDPNEVINVQYVAMNTNLYDCSNSTVDKTQFSVTITDEEGEDITDEFEAEVEMPPGVPCPEGCPYQKSTGRCICEDLSLFDVERQFQLVFAQSNIGKIAKLEALLSYEPLTSAPFWLSIGLTTWCIGSIVAVLTVAKKSCMVKSMMNSNTVGTGKKLWAAIVTSHPFISVYKYNDPEAGKATRAVIYYIRIIMMMTFVSIFNSDANVGTGTTARLLQESTEGDEGGESGGSSDVEFFSGSPYLILTPYITVIPIQAILYFLIKDSKEKKKKSKNKKDGQPKEPEQTPNQPKKPTKVQKVKKSIGFFLTFVIMIGCLFIIFIIDAQVEGNERLRWSYRFIQTILQDFFITPIIFILTQFVFIALFATKFVQKNDKKKEKVYGLIRQNIKDIYGLKENDSNSAKAAITSVIAIKKFGKDGKKQEVIEGDIAPYCSKDDIDPYCSEQDIDGHIASFSDSQKIDKKSSDKQGISVNSVDIDLDINADEGSKGINVQPVQQYTAGHPEKLFQTLRSKSRLLGTWNEVNSNSPNGKSPTAGGYDFSNRAIDAEKLKQTPSEEGLVQREESDESTPKGLNMKKMTLFAQNGKSQHTENEQ